MTEIKHHSDNCKGWIYEDASNCACQKQIKSNYPYSVREARMVAERHQMDVYHKELMLYLCKRVENAEALLTDCVNNDLPFDLYCKVKYWLNNDRNI